MQIIRYTKDYYDIWHDLLTRSKNGLFLFKRKYMEYHSNRFLDHSLLILKDSKIIAIWPANEENGHIVSHAGLTYGGVILSEKIHATDVIEIITDVFAYYKNHGYKSITYKSIPYLFHKIPAQEDLYAIQLAGGKIIKRELSSIIHFDSMIKLSDSRKNTIQKALKNGIKISESFDIADCYYLIEAAIKKYGKKPTHSIDDLILLTNLFPDNIKVYRAYNETNITLACAIIYIFDDKVVHTQYLATSDVGKKIGALDLLIYQLLIKFSHTSKYFSFGISTENNGLNLNQGLIRQKEGFGARGITIDTYKITLDN